MRINITKRVIDSLTAAFVCTHLYLNRRVYHPGRIYASKQNTFLLSVKLNSNSVAQHPMKTNAYCALPSIHSILLGAEVHEQMSRSGGQSEVRTPVFLSPSKLGTHLSIHCSRDERLSRTCPAQE
ncbi:hypothetical protein TNCV_1313911 [Trichonephila clavipes]|nr:hypothetical protein TNCV_1313911 [Trichonephila clavipes]